MELLFKGLLFFCGALIGFILKELYNIKVKPRIKKFNDNHNFPHEDECLVCKRGSCIEPYICHIISDAMEDKK
jgi:hypothetical protein